MSEADNLDSLSNAEIHAKCREHGLPNVPVTDTSRKLLLKKLRASLSGNDKAPQKSARRETISAVAIDDVPNNAGKMRESIAEDRRSTQSKANASKIVQEDTLPTQPAPIGRQRRSSSQGSNKSVTNQKVAEGAAPAKRFDAILEEDKQEQQTQSQPKEVNVRVASKLPQPAAISTRRTSTTLKVSEPSQPRNTLLTNSLIVIDSDDDDEMECAALMAESLNKKKQDTQTLKEAQLAQNKVKANLSKPINTDSTGASYGSSSAGGVPEVRQYTDSLLPQTAKQVPSRLSHYGSGRYTQPQQPSGSISSWRSNYNAAGISSSPYTEATNLASYNLHARPMPSVRRTEAPIRPAIFTDEFSDAPTDDEVVANSPFVSNFARNLERSKAQAESNRHYNYGRSALRKEHDVAGALSRFWRSLQRAFVLRRNLVILIVVVGLIGFYTLFF